MGQFITGFIIEKVSGLDLLEVLGVTWRARFKALHIIFYVMLRYVLGGTF